MPQPLIRSKKSGKRSHKRRSHKRHSRRTRSIRGGEMCKSCAGYTTNEHYCNKCQAIIRQVHKDLAARSAAIDSSKKTPVMGCSGIKRKSSHQN